ncbi:galactose-specific lectin nattectin-like isoform X2 [Homalodisca vitripennis]|uniref:galactose-specific lectin nattectin-like isoform X2 n=1 Tax=Homalodisca vitripennis TaxID=197043 RepID=UPI001EEA56AB|nr:galactose-specific lectin nattectin-like isoform X2 [Homalodisca vitripennis]
MDVSPLLVLLTGFVFVFGLIDDITGKKKYEAVITIPLNWVAAYQYCRREGGQLATITSKEKNDGFIIELNRIRGSLGNPEHCYWIGLTSLANFNYWYWMSTGKALVDFNAWDSGEPKSHTGSLRCASAGYKSETSWFWHSANCENICYFVCEYQG